MPIWVIEPLILIDPVWVVLPTFVVDPLTNNEPVIRIFCINGLTYDDVTAIEAEAAYDELVAIDAVAAYDELVAIDAVKAFIAFAELIEYDDVVAYDELTTNDAVEAYDELTALDDVKANEALNDELAYDALTIEPVPNGPHTAEDETYDAVWAVVIETKAYDADIAYDDVTEYDELTAIEAEVAYDELNAIEAVDEYDDDPNNEPVILPDTRNEPVICIIEAEANSRLERFVLLVPLPIIKADWAELDALYWPITDWYEPDATV